MRSCQSYHSSFADAAYRAFTTAAFVAPDVVVPRIAEQVARDLSGQEVEQLTESDLNIWQTPEGTAYVDGRRYTKCANLCPH